MKPFLILILAAMAALPQDVGMGVRRGSSSARYETPYSNEIVTPHPLIAATGNGTSGGIRVTASLRTSVRSESVPMLNDLSTGRPRQRVPSACA